MLLLLFERRKYERGGKKKSRARKRIGQAAIWPVTLDAFLIHIAKGMYVASATVQGRVKKYVVHHRDLPQQHRALVSLIYNECDLVNLRQFFSDVLTASRG